MPPKSELSNTLEQSLSLVHSDPQTAAALITLSLTTVSAAIVAVINWRKGQKLQEENQDQQQQLEEYRSEIIAIENQKLIFEATAILEKFLQELNRASNEEEKSAVANRYWQANHAIVQSGIYLALLKQNNTELLASRYKEKQKVTNPVWIGEKFEKLESSHLIIQGGSQEGAQVTEGYVAGCDFIDHKAMGLTLKNHMSVDCTYTNTDLSETQSADSSFNNCRFKNCKFRNMLCTGLNQFNQCTISDSDFSGADLSNVIFREVDFQNGNIFDNTILDGSRFEDCKNLPTEISNFLTPKGIYHVDFLEEDSNKPLVG